MCQSSPHRNGKPDWTEADHAIARLLALCPQGTAHWVVERILADLARNCVGQVREAKLLDEDRRRLATIRESSCRDAGGARREDGNDLLMEGAVEAAQQRSAITGAPTKSNPLRLASHPNDCGPFGWQKSPVKSTSSRCAQPRALRPSHDRSLRDNSERFATGRVSSSAPRRHSSPCRSCRRRRSRHWP